VICSIEKCNENFVNHCEEYPVTLSFNDQFETFYQLSNCQLNLIRVLLVFLLNLLTVTPFFYRHGNAHIEMVVIQECFGI